MRTRNRMRALTWRENVSAASATTVIKLCFLIAQKGAIMQKRKIEIVNKKKMMRNKRSMPMEAQAPKLVEKSVMRLHNTK